LRCRGDTRGDGRERCAAHMGRGHGTRDSTRGARGDLRALRPGLRRSPYHQRCRARLAHRRRHRPGVRWTPGAPLRGGPREQVHDRPADRGRHMSRILIAEDEPGISSFLEKGLQAAGFSTLVVEDGRTAAYAARDDDFDLLILDLGLPGLDGHEVLSEIRRRGERMPVIILTARSGVEDTVAGLEGGADDYVTKPFSFEGLLARVKVGLRDRGTREQLELQVGDVTLDLRTRRARMGDQEVELSAREFSLAELLFRHPDQVLSRQQILSHVWGYDFDPGSNVVDVYIRYLRKKLGSDLIETVRGMGYRLRT